MPIISNFRSFFRFLKRRPLLLIALFSFPLFFYRLGSWAFFDADEGRYGAIPREMIVNGDWITPTLNHIKFFDKPPLLYWSIASAYHVFGYQEFAARLIPALAALLGVLLAWALGRRMFGERVGRWSAIILATTVMWPVLARVVVTDMLVSSLVFCALALWWLGHVEDKRRKQTCFFLGFWGALALAVLAKGPVTIVLSGGVILGYCLLCRRWDALREMRFVPGAIFFFAVAAPWFIAVATRNPEFNGYFWYDQHIARFFGDSISGEDHIAGVDYFLKLLPLVLFPWSAFLPAAICAAFFAWKNGALQKRNSPRHRAGVFLLCAIGFITLFFSASSSKLITYLLPILPPTAILLAVYFEQLRQKSDAPQRILWTGALALSGVLLTGAVFGALRGAPKFVALGGSHILIFLVCALLGAWSGALCLATLRRNVRTLLLATSGGFASVFVAGLFVISAIAPQFTTPSLLAYIQPGINAGAEVDTLPYTQSVGFYTRSRIKMLGSPSELAFGIAQMSPADRRYWVTEEKFGITRLQHLEADLKLRTPVYFLVRKTRKNAKLLAELSSPPRNIPINKIIENERFLIIGNAAAIALTPPKTKNKFEHNS
jgi:4-amino-4-deoxy-L-arabinose transferase-like glycosyltransferase